MNHYATGLGVALLSAAVLAQQPARRDGNWEVTMQMQMDGMPGAMPPQTIKQCVTKEEAEDPTKLMPQAGRGGAAPECKVTDQKVTGNKVSWSMTCTGQMAMSGTGEFVYNDNTYDGTMKMNMERGGQPMAMTMTYKGKRLGDCVK
jgi:hypothetical protein